MKKVMILVLLGCMSCSLLFPESGWAMLHEEFSRREDAALRKVVGKVGTSNWEEVADELGWRKTARQCRRRWDVLASRKEHTVRAPQIKFAPEEDARLGIIVGWIGTGNWQLVAMVFNGPSDELRSELPDGLLQDLASLPVPSQHRNTRQCRERWKNYLNHQLDTKPFTQEEDAFICRQVREIGTKWGVIADLTGRGRNAVHNRWEQLLRRGPPPPSPNGVPNSVPLRTQARGGRMGMLDFSVSSRSGSDDSDEEEGGRLW
ncbi:MAG: hypothetical protein LBJ70_05455 [Holosporales bacterium]|jgi:hypothetical protein|nr:hypothetical protein [Holosporales bacterium]